MVKKFFFLALILINSFGPILGMQKGQFRRRSLSMDGNPPLLASHQIPTLSSSRTIGHLHHQVNRLQTQVGQLSTLFAAHNQGLTAPEPIPSQPIDDELIETIILSFPSDISEQLKVIIDRLAHDKYYDRGLPRKMLLIGYPGLGKTTLAKGIAQRTGRKWKFYKATDMLTSYRESGNRNLNKIFQELHQELEKNPENKYVIIIDEINRFFDRYNDREQADRTTATELWQWLDVFYETGRVFFIGMANDLNNIPEALKSRFDDDETIKLNKPDFKARIRIIQFHLQGINHNLDYRFIKFLARKTARLDSRRIKQKLIDNAIGFAEDRARNSNNSLLVTKEDFSKAVSKLKIESRFKELWNKIYTKENKPYIIGGAVTVGVATASALVGLYMWHCNRADAAVARVLQEKGLELQQATHGLQDKGLVLQQAAYVLQNKGIELQQEVVDSSINCNVRQCYLSLKNEGIGRTCTDFIWDPFIKPLVIGVKNNPRTAATAAGAAALTVICWYGIPLKIICSAAVVCLSNINSK